MDCFVFIFYCVQCTLLSINKSFICICDVGIDLISELFYFLMTFLCGFYSHSRSFTAGLLF